MRDRRKPTGNEEAKSKAEAGAEAEAEEKRPRRGRNIAWVVASVVFLIALQHYAKKGVPEGMETQTLLWEGKYDEAIAKYTDMIKGHPWDPWSYSRRGEAYLGKGDVDRAIADLDEAVRQKPDLPEARYNRCRAFAAKRELDRAVADCEESVKLKSDDWTVQNCLGRRLLSQGECDRAAERFTSVIQIAAHSADPFFYRGQILLFHNNRPAEAAEDFAKAAKAALEYRDIGLMFGAQDADGVKSTNLMATGHAFMPDGIYVIIWNHIARARAGQDDAAELAEHAKELAAPIRRKMIVEEFRNIGEEPEQKSREPWPGAILGLFLGKTTPAAVPAAAEATSDPDLRRRRICDADFYLAEYYREKGANDDVRGLLQAAADGCPASAREGGFAKADLKRLGT